MRSAIQPRFATARRGTVSGIIDTMVASVAHWARAIGIRPGEGRLVGAMSLLFALLEVGRGMGEIGASTLVLRGYGPDGLAEALPFLYIGLGVIGLGVAAGYMTALGRVRRRPLSIGLLALLATLIAATWVAFGVGLPAALPGMWLVVFTANAIVMTLSWAIASSAFDARQARRLFPLLTGAAIAGYFVGTLSAGPITAVAGAATLLIAEAVALVVAIPLAAGLVRPTPLQVGSRASVVGELRAGFDVVAGSPLMRRVAIAYVLLAVLMFSVSFPFDISAAATFGSPAELASALGLLSATITGTSFLVSILVANRLYARFGVTIGAVALPVVYLAGFSLWLVSFSFTTAAAFRFTQQVTQRGLSNASWSALYTAVPSDRRAQVIAFNDGVPVQVGTILSGLLLLAAGRALAPDQVFWLGAITAAIAIIVVVGIRRGYGASLIAALRSGPAERVLEGGPDVALLVRDPSVGAALRVALDAPEPGVREMAVSMLGTSDITSDADALRRRLSDEDARVRAAAIRALGRRGDQKVWNGVDLDSLTVDPDVRVRAAALVARARYQNDSDAFVRLAQDPSDAVRAAAIAAFADHTLDERTREAAIRALGDETTRVRETAASVLGADTGSEPDLVVVVVHGSAVASRAALRALAERTERSGPNATIQTSILEFALERMDRATEQRQDRAVLVAAGMTGPADPHDLLAHALATRERDHLRSGLGSLAVLGAPEASGLIRRCLADRDPQVRAQAIEAIESVGDRRLARSVVRLLEDDGTTRLPDRSVVLVRLAHDEDEWLRRLAQACQGGAAVPDATRSLSDLETMLALRRVPLFEGLDPEDLQRIAATAIERTYASGDVLMREGEPGDALVVLLEGSVRVERAEPDGSMRLIRTYDAGEHIGELAVLRERPRAATVVAQADGARGLVVAGSALTAILRERPDAAMAMLATLAERISRQ